MKPLLPKLSPQTSPKLIIEGRSFSLKSAITAITIPALYITEPLPSESHCCLWPVRVFLDVPMRMFMLLMSPSPSSPTTRIGVRMPVLPFPFPFTLMFRAPVLTLKSIPHLTKSETILAFTITSDQRPRGSCPRTTRTGINHIDPCSCGNILRYAPSPLVEMGFQRRREVEL